MPSTTVNGVSLHYEVAATARRCCSSPASARARSPGPLPARSCKRFTVITVDNRGTGRSEVPPGPYPIDDLADDTAALVEHLGLGPGRRWAGRWAARCCSRC